MRSLLIAPAVVFWAMGLGGMTRGPARQEDPRDTTVTLTVNRVSVREAMRRLFGVVHAKCIVDPDVRGDVTASYREVPFETALRGLLDQVDGTYIIGSGVYGIVKRDFRSDTAPDDRNPELP
jgi:type II secretory pathway component GspD/PulD (secretin)